MQNLKNVRCQVCIDLSDTPLQAASAARLDATDHGMLDETDQSPRRSWCKHRDLSIADADGELRGWTLLASSILLFRTTGTILSQKDARVRIY